jgi:hypothetical protein
VPSSAALRIVGFPFYYLEYRLGAPPEYPCVPPGNHFLTLDANVPRAAHCAVGAVQAAPPAPVPSPHGGLAASMGCSRCCSCGGEHGCATKARTRPPRADRPNGSASPARPHARTGAVALDPFQWFGVVGNHTTLLVALAAGFGGAFACLLVVVIVMVLRNRRAARATDPAPGLRTPLYGE